MYGYPTVAQEFYRSPLIITGSVASARATPEADDSTGRYEGTNRDTFLGFLALALILLWPLVVGASITLSARRLRLAGGRTRREGLTALWIAFGLALFTLVFLVI